MKMNEMSWKRVSKIIMVWYCGKEVADHGKQASNKKKEKRNVE